MSRPEKPIDWKRVDEMLEAGCLGTEIAANYDVHPNTFYDRVVQKYGLSFTDYCSEKRFKGESNLREAQYKKAIKKLDNTMLIWLGKQRLGQRENPGEKVIAEDVMKAFNELMTQLDKAQSERKMEQSNIITEAKSACETEDKAASTGRASIF